MFYKTPSSAVFLAKYYNCLIINLKLKFIFWEIVIWMLEQYLPFVALIIFGNIENLVLSSQGVVAGVNPVIEDRKSVV